MVTAKVFTPSEGLAVKLPPPLVTPVTFKRNWKPAKFRVPKVQVEEGSGDHSSKRRARNWRTVGLWVRSLPLLPDRNHACAFEASTGHRRNRPCEQS